MVWKNICLLAFIGFSIICPDRSLAQDEKLESPKQTIASLFKAMKNGDGELAEKVFMEGASLHTVLTEKSGKKNMKVSDVGEFIEAIKKPHEAVWDERISNLIVNIDGDLAQAWMDYSFYVDEKFSHCGVNAMHLVKNHGDWKIFQIVDTRRDSNCK